MFGLDYSLQMYGAMNARSLLWVMVSLVMLRGKPSGYESLADALDFVLPTLIKQPGVFVEMSLKMQQGSEAPPMDARGSRCMTCAQMLKIARTHNPYSLKDQFSSQMVDIAINKCVGAFIECCRELRSLNVCHRVALSFDGSKFDGEELNPPWE